MTDAHSPSAKLVFLNVSGQVFQTTLATLQGGSSMLSKMFSGQMEPGLRDEQGRVYIDRSPKHFGIVLDCLRCGGTAEAAAALLPTSRSEQRQLLLEAQYYGCEGLVAALEAAEQEWAHRQALELKRLAAAAAIDSSRAAVLQEAEEAEAAEATALQQAHAELKAVDAEAKLLLAAAGAAAAAPRADLARASYVLKNRASQAWMRGRRATQDVLAARLLCLAALGGGAERAAAALWRRKEAAMRALGDARTAIENTLREALNDEDEPPGLDFHSDSDGEEDPWARDGGAAAARPPDAAARAAMPLLVRRPAGGLRPALAERPDGRGAAMARLVAALAAVPGMGAGANPGAAARAAQLHAQQPAPAANGRLAAQAELAELELEGLMDDDGLPDLLPDVGSDDEL